MAAGKEVTSQQIAADWIAAMSFDDDDLKVEAVVDSLTIQEVQDGNL